jgi:hypothetical protein
MIMILSNFVMGSLSCCKGYLNNIYQILVISSQRQFAHDSFILLFMTSSALHIKSGTTFLRIWFKDALSLIFTDIDRWYLDFILATWTISYNSSTELGCHFWITCNITSCVNSIALKGYGGNLGGLDLRVVVLRLGWTLCLVQNMGYLQIDAAASSVRSTIWLDLMWVEPDLINFMIFARAMHVIYPKPYSNAIRDA